MIDRLHTVAFTGHRHYRGQADEALRNLLVRLSAQGYTTFLSGMALGFDMAAAEQVVALRDAGALMRLVAVVPFAGQGEHYPPSERARYESLLARADEVIILDEAFHRWSYSRRNDFLVEHASHLVAWYTGEKGGTQYTFLKALRGGLEVDNLGTFETLNLTLFKP